MQAIQVRKEWVESVVLGSTVQGVLILYPGEPKEPGKPCASQTERGKSVGKQAEMSKLAGVSVLAGECE